MTAEKIRERNRKSPQIQLDVTQIFAAYNHKNVISTVETNLNVLYFNVYFDKIESFSLCIFFFFFQ